jgi:dsDNA-binding SOS-regulon protein
LRELQNLVETIPLFDKLVADYVKVIADKYDLLLDYYNKFVDEKIQENAEHLFPGEYYKKFLLAKNHADLYEKFLASARKNHEFLKRKPVWKEIINRHDAELDFTLHSGK